MLINSYNTFTNDRKISYEQKVFLKSTLRKLGLNPSNNGTKLFFKIVLIAYIKDMITINFEGLCRMLSIEQNISSKTISSEIKYSINSANFKKARETYKNIFGIEFESDFFTPRNLISDLKDILENINFENKR